MPLSLIVLVNRELTEQRGGHGVGAVASLRFGEKSARDLCSAQSDITDDPSRYGIGDDIHARDRCGVIGDARGAEGMAADPGARAELGGAALDHAPGIDAVHSRYGERSGAAGGGAEEGALAADADAGRLDIRVERASRL